MLKLSPSFPFPSSCFADYRNDLPLQGVVRKFSGLVSPHSGCTRNKFSEQSRVVGSLTTYDVTGLISLSLVQRVGAGSFNQARSERQCVFRVLCIGGASLLVPSPKAQGHGPHVIWAIGLCLLKGWALSRR